MRIPKTIHYCWFGGNPKPKLAKKCIRSWKKYCPDYEIIEWNEDNYDFSQAPQYVRQAYDAGKWAFVTDYVRLQVVYEQGGIYLDTDVELRKSLDSLRQHRAYFGFENEKAVATGLGFGAEKGLKLLADMMKDYQDLQFLLPDGSFNVVPCPVYNTACLQKYGLIPNGETQLLPGDIQILSREYLCPLDYVTGVMQRTEKTVSIHWYSASWHTRAEERLRKKDARKMQRERILFQISRMPNRIGRAVFGEERYVKIRTWLKGHA